ncbi:MAG: NAD(P)/FAD-dependent oxidoreductase [Egibacteraceae bacterium]
MIIVGAGLAGLCCAVRLSERGRRPLVLEASDDVGGRVRTDRVDGFQLDRGFQVLLTAYPEARRLLDYEALELQPFSPGVLVWRGTGFEALADPFRAPEQALRSLTSGVGGWGDKLRLARLRLTLSRSSPAQLRGRPDVSTISELRALGFGNGIIESFFRPFLGSVFFDRRLETSSRMFAFVMRSFFGGSTAVPAAGMGAIPRQLAAWLPADAVRTRCAAVEVGEGTVRLEGGDELTAEIVVVATEAPVAASLVPTLGPARSRGAVTMYFAAPEPPTREPTLMLDGARSGPADLVAVLSNVAGSYAPPGQALVAVALAGGSAAGDASLEAAIRRQLTGWFGSQVSAWSRIGLYRIAHALPDQTAPAPLARRVRFGDRLFICGDHRDTPSIQGAMVSGRRTADTITAAT